jgi:hypothetical protein
MTSDPDPRDAALKGMLQSLEHVLDTVDRVSDFAGQLVAAERAGKPLAPSTLTYYETQLASLSHDRARMRELVSTWWTLLEEGH